MWWLTTKESVSTSIDNTQCELIIMLAWTSFKCFFMFRKMDDGDDKFIQSKLKWRSHELITSQKASLTVPLWRDFKDLISFLTQKTATSIKQSCGTRVPGEFYSTWYHSIWAQAIQIQYCPIYACRYPHDNSDAQGNKNIFSASCTTRELVSCAIITRRASVRWSQLGGLASEELINYTLTYKVAVVLGSCMQTDYRIDTGKADAAAVFH